MSARLQIYRAFAARSAGEFPVSWTRKQDTDFDDIRNELQAMDTEGLIRCLFCHQDVVITAQLNPAGIAAMRGALDVTKQS